jgi:DNA-directed RNA polymerase subunit RPC12/RpoP
MAQCPNCGSRYLRESKRSDESLKPSHWKFEKQLRCLDCQTRFVGSTLELQELRYAHCPQCDRMDLNQWTGKNYVPPFWAGLCIRMGAKRWRCEYCRINFASFRRRKEVFTFKRWVNMNSGSAVADGRARRAAKEMKADEQRELDEARERAAERAQDITEPR